jgi:hypothetical protein
VSEAAVDVCTVVALCKYCAISAITIQTPYVVIASHDLIMNRFTARNSSIRRQNCNFRVDLGEAGL